MLGDQWSLPRVKDYDRVTVVDVRPPLCKFDIGKDVDPNQTSAPTS